jgi:WD40 repeat protein
LRSGQVTAVKFASEGIVASSSTDGSTKFWDLGTGQETEKTAEAVPEGFTFPKEGGTEEKRINSYVVAAKGQTLVIHKAPEDKAETAADGSDGSDGKAGTETPVAFFQCSSDIRAFDVEGAKIAVGCADGQVLQLFAAVLQTQA